MTGTSGPITLDPTGRRLYTQADQLRAMAPAVRVQLPDGITAWSVSRGDIVRRLLHHPHISKNARTSWPGYRPGAVPWLTAWVDVVSMFTSDRHDHRRLRDLVAAAFTPRRIDAMRPAIEAAVTEVLDSLGTTAPGATIDLRARFSYPIPTRVICDLFGVPGHQRPAMLRVIDAVLDTSLTRGQAQHVRHDLFTAMHTLVAAKRARPGDDMTSVLIAAQHDDGDKLSDDELISTLILMIGAGSETAVSLIDHAAHELLTHPDTRACVLDDPARWDDVIEETLRLHPPIMHLPMRYATAEIDLGDGITIRTGDLVLIAFGAHGRDPHTHPAPERFDIDRADKQHLAFGHGAHYCLGAPLARLEARIALPALFTRLPHLRLAPGHERPSAQPSFIGNDFRALPVIPQPPS